MGASLPVPVQLTVHLLPRFSEGSRESLMANIFMQEVMFPENKILCMCLCVHGVCMCVCLQFREEGETRLTVC